MVLHVNGVKMKKELVQLDKVGMAKQARDSERGKKFVNSEII